MDITTMRIVATLVSFAAFIGIVVFCLTFIVVDKLTPYDLWKELVETKNTALAIVVGLGELSAAQAFATADATSSFDCSASMTTQPCSAACRR